MYFGHITPSCWAMATFCSKLTATHFLNQIQQQNEAIPKTLGTCWIYFAKMQYFLHYTSTNFVSVNYLTIQKEFWAISESIGWLASSFILVTPQIPARH
jgi:hypothetical protein